MPAERSAKVLSVLSITLPIFAIIAVGFLAVRYGPFSRDTMRALGDYTMMIALPCALFHAVAGRDFAEVIDASYLGTLAIAGLATHALMWGLARMQQAGPKRRALAVLASATPNSAFLGYPIFLMVIPDHAAPVLAMNLLIENFLLTPIGLTLLGSAREDGEARLPPLKLAGQIILSVLRRPLIIGLILGMATVLAGVELPSVIERFTGILGTAASPLALTVIGGSLVGLNLRGDLRLASLIAGTKLLIHPLMIFCAIALFAALGWPALGPELRIGVLLTGCLPMFAIFTLFAQEVGHEGLASLALMLATGLSFLTINLALVLLV